MKTPFASLLLASLASVLTLSGAWARPDHPTKYEPLRLAFDTPNPDWAEKISLDRMGYLLAQRMYGDQGRKKIDYLGPEHKSVRKQLSALASRYPILAVQKFSGALGLEKISMNEVDLGGAKTFSGLVMNDYLVSDKVEKKEQVLKDAAALLSGFGTDDVSTLASTNTFGTPSDKYASYYRSVEKKVSLYDWRKEPTTIALSKLGLDELKLTLKYQTMTANGPLDETTLSGVRLELVARRGMTDMNYILRGVKTLFPGNKLVDALALDKDRKIEGMVADGFQFDDVVPYREANGTRHWIYYLPNFEGSDYLDFVVTTDAAGLVTGTRFAELCFESMNGSVDDKRKIFIDEGFTPTGVQVLSSSGNGGCAKLRYGKGEYQPYTLGARSILD